MPKPTHSPKTIDPSSIELAVDLLQQRIDTLQQNLAEQNKLATLGMVAAVLAHEFNNILTPMISYTTFALSDKSDEALRQKALTKALAGAQRLANISQSLLGFAKGDGDGGGVANIRQAVSETLSCLARDFAKDAITLTLDIPDSLNADINAGQLQQVLMNLIVNARAAMLSPQHAGPKRLTIKAAAVPESNTVQIFLTDTGPGIPDHVLPRIFDPFFSTKSNADDTQASDSLPRGGTGLGLTICQQLITAAGGSLKVESQPGKGAAFILVLPQRRPAEASPGV